MEVCGIWKRRVAVLRRKNWFLIVDCLESEMYHPRKQKVSTRIKVVSVYSSFIKLGQV